MRLIDMLFENLKVGDKFWWRGVVYFISELFSDKSFVILPEDGNGTGEVLLNFDRIKDTSDPSSQNCDEIILWEPGIRQFRILYSLHGSKELKVVVLGPMTKAEAFKKYFKWAESNTHGSSDGKIEYSEVARLVMLDEAE